MNHHNQEEPVHVPIEDVIDLHSFRPSDVPDLLEEYLRACARQKIFSVRIIHGKGKGILKKTVHRCLSGHPLVLSFQDAGNQAGGWGATRVVLRAGTD